MQPVPHAVHAVVAAVVPEPKKPAEQVTAVIAPVPVPVQPMTFAADVLVHWKQAALANPYPAIHPVTVTMVLVAVTPVQVEACASEPVPLPIAAIHVTQAV